MAEFEVEAAGGVIVRRGEMGEPEVLIVHRPRYDDWSIPKGKLDNGETHEQGALREILEETGLVCRLGQTVADSHYTDHKGRSKRVRYYLMESLEGSFAPNNEVDEVRWHQLATAENLVSYSRDAEILSAAGQLMDLQT
jgi:8-oxo-dGTP pyrophosphatase MutT (NUDIX family)